ncbi:Uncharacterised protein [Chlamydia trachomatis]|nr:Uncharacterised protein [Chlamydia trachomatis]
MIPSSLYLGNILKILLLAFLNSGETTFLASPVETAKEISVGGTSRFSKLPLIESLPPIAPTPKSICALKAPRIAAIGFPQRSGTL